MNRFNGRSSGGARRVLVIGALALAVGLVATGAMSDAAAFARRASDADVESRAPSARARDAPEWTSERPAEFRGLVVARLQEAYAPPSGQHPKGPSQNATYVIELAQYVVRSSEDRTEFARERVQTVTVPADADPHVTLAHTLARVTDQNARAVKQWAWSVGTDAPNDPEARRLGSLLFDAVQDSERFARGATRFACTESGGGCPAGDALREALNLPGVR